MTVKELIQVLLQMPLDRPVAIETSDGGETDIQGVRCEGYRNQYVYLTPADRVIHEEEVLSGFGL